jgi:hypothetical protein
MSFATFRFIFSTMDASLHFCISRVTLLWRHNCRRLWRYFCCTHEYCVKYFKQGVISLGLFIYYWIVYKRPSPNSVTHFCTLIQRYSINLAWQRYTEDHHVLSLTSRLRQYSYRNTTKLSSQNNIQYLIMGRSQWPRGLRRGLGAALLLELWVRIPSGAWTFFSCECFVFSGRGLWVGLITRPEESYRMWCVVVCDLETSRMRRPCPTLSSNATLYIYIYISHYPDVFLD